ncbi:MAG: DUF4870 domain-containing protein, partial [Phycisphaeraceae bacterium]
MNKIIDFFKPRTIEWTGEEPDQAMRDWCMFLHLSSLSALITGIGFLLGPLIMWIIKKDESNFVDAHGRAALDFSISALILGTAAGLTLFICIGIVIAPVVVLGLLVAWIVGLIQSIQAAKAGKLYRYPASF